MNFGYIVPADAERAVHIGVVVAGLQNVRRLAEAVLGIRRNHNSHARHSRVFSCSSVSLARRAIPAVKSERAVGINVAAQEKVSVNVSGIWRNVTRRRHPLVLRQVLALLVVLVAQRVGGSLTAGRVAVHIILVPSVVRCCGGHRFGTESHVEVRDRTMNVVCGSQP